MNPTSWKTKNRGNLKALQLLETRHGDVWPYSAKRAARIARQVAAAVHEAAPGWQPSVILEIGAGPFHPLSHGLVFYLNGASTLIATDFPEQLHDTAQAARASFNLAADALAFPENFAFEDTPERKAGILTRAKQLPLAAMQEGDWSALLRFGGARFAYASLNQAQQHLPPGQFDFLFSIAVLEHVEQPQEVLRWHHQLLKPGSIGYHLVGLEDHRYFETPDTFPPWHFMIDGEYGHASTIRQDLRINGLRSSQWREQFALAGFDCLLWREENVYPVPAGLSEQLRAEFRILPPKDLECFRIEAVVRKR
jgi:SAM-dependent methyltransferase